MGGQDVVRIPEMMVDAGRDSRGEDAKSTNMRWFARSPNPCCFSPFVDTCSRTHSVGIKLALYGYYAESKDLL